MTEREQLRVFLISVVKDMPPSWTAARHIKLLLAGRVDKLDRMLDREQPWLVTGLRLFVLGHKKTDPSWLERYNLIVGYYNVAVGGAWFRAPRASWEIANFMFRETTGHKNLIETLIGRLDQPRRSLLNQKVVQELASLV